MFVCQWREGGAEAGAQIKDSENEPDESGAVACGGVICSRFISLSVKRCLLRLPRTAWLVLKHVCRHHLTEKERGNAEITAITSRDCCC